MSDILGGIGSILGIGSGLKGLFGGSQQGGSSSSNAYVPTGLGQSDQQFQDFLKQYGGWASQLAGATGPYMGQAFGEGSQLPIGQQYKQLSGMTPQMMQMLMQQAGTAQGAQQGLMGAGNQLWNTAQDPQNALRNQLMQQVQDQSRAGSSMRGIGMSPQAAGLENQAMNNFLNQWQNQQLGRQAQGLQGMTNAYGQAGQQGNAVGQSLTGALGIGAMGPGFLEQGAQWPFQLSGMYGQGMQGNTMNPYLAGMGSIIPYLNSGQGATGQLFGQQQFGLNNLTTGLGQLSNLFRQQPQPYYPGQGYGSAGSEDPSGGGAMVTPY